MAGFKSANNRRNQDLSQQHAQSIKGAQLNRPEVARPAHPASAASASTTPSPAAAAQASSLTPEQRKAFDDEYTYNPLYESSSRAERRANGTLTRADKAADNENTPNYAPKTPEEEKATQIEPPAKNPTDRPGSLADRIGDKQAARVGKEKLGGTPFDKNAGAGGVKGASAKGGKRVANYIKRHPKGVIVAVIAIIGAFLSFVVFIVSLPFQLINMAKNLLSHNFDAGDRIEQKAERRVIARLFQAREASPAEGAKKATGRPIADKIANMRMDRFNKMLAKDNLKLVFDENSGRLTGIKNTVTGETVNDFKESTFTERRAAIGNLVSERIAPWRVLKRVHYTKVMKYHARVSFRFWPKEKVQDMKKLFTEKVRQGASAAEFDEGKAKDGATQEEIDKAKAALAEGGANDAVDGVKATADEYASTGDKVKAIAKGISSFKGAKLGFGITGIMALVCTVKQMADDAATTGYLDRAEQLMRVGNMITTQVAQLYTGEDLDIDKFGQTMAAYTGNPNAADPANRKGWDQSAAAKRMAGQPVDSAPTKSDGSANPYYNPDLPEDANPDGFALLGIVQTVDTVFNYVPGANFVCSAVTSVFGYIIQGVELVVGVISGGTEIVASLAAQAAVQTVIFSVVLPKVLAAAAALAVTGTENAVDMFNNADAGMALSAADYERSSGGYQLSTEQHDQLVYAAKQEKVQIAREKGWFYRTLDITNQDSVAANLLMKVPNTPQTAVAALTNLPKTFAVNFGAIFLGGPRPVFAETVADNGNPYKFQYYGLTDADIDKYDPIDNEAYLAQPLPGEPSPENGGRTRLSILGDPSTYSPASGDDPSKTNLHHCFVNDLRAPTGEQDEICRGLGIATSGSDSAPNPGNPGLDVIAKIYADAGFPGLALDDDFTRYAVELKYVHATRGLECMSTDEDCYQGNGTAAAPTSGTPGGTGGVPAGDARALAKQLAENPNMIWTQDATKQALLTYGNGGQVTNACGEPMGVSPYLTGALLALSSKYKVTVDDIGFGSDRSYCETGTYQHPKGNAIDIRAIEILGGASTSPNLHNYPADAVVANQFATDFLAKLPPGPYGGVGQKQCGMNPTWPSTSTNINGAALFEDSCDHLHIDVRNRDNLNEAAGAP